MLIWPLWGCWRIQTISLRLQGRQRIASIPSCKEDTSVDSLDLVVNQCSRDELYQLLLECIRKRDFATGRQVHLMMTSRNLDSVPVLGDCLIKMFASCGSLDEARKSFDKVDNPTAFTWNAIIAAHVKLGESHEALQLFIRMKKDRAFPVKSTFVYVLKACSNINDIYLGRLVHEQIVHCGLDSDLIISSAVIGMYTKCCLVQEANKVFDGIGSHDVVSWGVLIGGLAENGYVHFALCAFGGMQKDGIEPNAVIFMCVFKACGSLGAIVHGHVLHHYALCFEVEGELKIINSLIDMYARCGSLDDAYAVFSGSSKRDEVSWGTLIHGCVQHDHCLRAIELYKKMQYDSMRVNEMIYSNVLKACDRLNFIEEGHIVHSEIIQMGFESDRHIECGLVDMYSSFKSLDEAHKIFDSVGYANEACWNVMITGYVSQGCGYAALELFDLMQARGVKLSQGIFINALKACMSLYDMQLIKIIHDQVVCVAIEQDAAIGSTLVDTYSRCGSLSDACHVFETISDKDVLCWNALLACRVEHGHHLAALSLFDEMQGGGIKPDKVIYLHVLRACGCINDIQQGRRIHCQILNSEFKLDEVVGSSLIDMYVKCRSLHEAHAVFLGLHCRDAAVWAALIDGYVQHEQIDTAIQHFIKMMHEGLVPSKAICLAILKAFMNMHSMGLSMQLHSWTIESGFESDIVIGTALVDMYVKKGSLSEACNIFDSSSDWDVVSWGTMIAGYVLHEHGACALELYGKMLKCNIKPDKVTLLASLKACILAGAPQQGRLMHKHILVAGLELDVNIGTALIDMYARCGCLEDAYRTLKMLPGSNVVSWGALIAGSGALITSKVKDWIAVMRQEDLQPDSVIFLSVLVACSHAGLLEDGCMYFKSMREEYGILPTIQHYNCMIDILGRSGYLKEAEDLLQSIPSPPDIVGWLALLCGCRIYGDMLLGGQCYNEIVKLDQSDASGHMLMSSIYCESHLWEIANEAQELRNLTRAWKQPGRASLEINTGIHEFVVEDYKEMECNEGSCGFLWLNRALKQQGYVPDAGLVFDPRLNLSKIF